MREGGGLLSDFYGMHVYNGFYPPTAKKCNTNPR